MSEPPPSLVTEARSHLRSPFRVGDEPGYARRADELIERLIVTFEEVTGSMVAEIGDLQRQIINLEEQSKLDLAELERRRTQLRRCEGELKDTRNNLRVTKRQLQESASKRKATVGQLQRLQHVLADIAAWEFCECGASGDGLCPMHLAEKALASCSIG